MGVQLASAGQRGELVGTLTARGYAVTDLTGDELAKVHIRHMVGAAPRRPRASASIPLPSPNAPAHCWNS